MILFSSDLELLLEKKIIMNKLIIDVANEKIFLMIITNNDIYNITHENTKINYEKLTIIIKDFLGSISLKISDIQKIYINRGPGSFAGIRNSLSVVKAFNITKKIDEIRLSYDGRSCFREVPGINIDYIENRKQMLEFIKGSISLNSPIQKLEGISDISEMIMNHLFELPYIHSE